MVKELLYVEELLNVTYVEELLAVPCDLQRRLQYYTSSFTRLTISLHAILIIALFSMVFKEYLPHLHRYLTTTTASLKPTKSRPGGEDSGRLKQKSLQFPQ